MNLGELRELALDWLDDPSAGYFTTPIMNMRLNLALKELQKDLISANKQFYTACVKTNTVVNQPNYALPSDFLQVIRLSRVTQGTGALAQTQPIIPITPNERDVAVLQPGLPDWFWFAKDEVFLYPIPNQVIELRLEYSYIVGDMVNDGDEPDAPEDFHEYIAVLATRDGFLKDGRPIAPINDKMDRYRMLLKQIANQRNAQTARMVTYTGMGWDGGF